VQITSALKLWSQIVRSRRLIAYCEVDRIQLITHTQRTVHVIFVQYLRNAYVAVQGYIIGEIRGSSTTLSAAVPRISAGALGRSQRRLQAFTPDSSIPSLALSLFAEPCHYPIGLLQRVSLNVSVKPTNLTCMSLLGEMR
jgi:hypothetical protein